MKISYFWKYDLKNIAGNKEKAKQFSLENKQTILQFCITKENV